MILVLFFVVSRWMDYSRFWSASPLKHEANEQKNLRAALCSAHLALVTRKQGQRPAPIPGASTNTLHVFTGYLGS